MARQVEIECEDGTVIKRGSIINGLVVTSVVQAFGGIIYIDLEDGSQIIM